jgi:hypothetical protein
MAWTTPAFVAEMKTVTRRNWKPSTVKRFQKGVQFKAVTSNYGGEVIGIGEIAENPYKQSTRDMDDMDDYIAEGFSYMDSEFAELDDSDLLPLYCAMKDWQQKDQMVTVVPFKIVEVFPGMLEKYTTDDEIRRCVKALVKAIG